jgi:hypothetical protein
MDLSARFRTLGNSPSSPMRTFFHQYSEDLQVMANLQGKVDREGLLKIRAQIDQMRSQNMRQAALEIWNDKVKSSGPISAR